MSPDPASTPIPSDDQTSVPSVQSEPGALLPRRRGGQPGNLNALKHGLYLDGRRIVNSTPVELAQLYDVTDLISRIKDFMAFTYDYGIRSREIHEINETMRALSLAAMSLTRLADLHREHTTVSLHKDIQVTDDTDIASIIQQYQQRLAPYLDLINND